jgi:hypothetical protein
MPDPTFPTSIAAPAAFPVVELRDLFDTVRLTAQVLEPSGEQARRNVTPLKPYGSLVQGFKGDGTPIIGTDGRLSLDIRVSVSQNSFNYHNALQDILVAVRTCYSLRCVRDGVAWTRQIAAGDGIETWSQLGDTVRCTIVLLPVSEFWSDGANERFGVL